MLDTHSMTSEYKIHIQSKQIKFLHLCIGISMFSEKTQTCKDIHLVFMDVLIDYKFYHLKYNTWEPYCFVRVYCTCIHTHIHTRAYPFIWVCIVFFYSFICNNTVVNYFCSVSQSSLYLMCIQSLETNKCKMLDLTLLCYMKQRFPTYSIVSLLSG